jgi:cytochrome c-type biogenesis protein
MVLTLGLSLLAGILSTLSPCVLPLVPIVLAAALGEHRLGPVALAAGLAISFTSIGLFVATIGFAIGLDGDVFRNVAATIMLAFGIVLAMPPLQVRLATAAGPVGNWVEHRFGGFSSSGPGGQFATGILLGAVWSPCVGPTLGAASVLAAQGKDLTQVGVTMSAFGVGAVLPLLLLGLLSREASARWRKRLGTLGYGSKLALGLVLIATSGAVLSGFDKILEARLVSASPDWLTTLTTSF